MIEEPVQVRYRSPWGGIDLHTTHPMVEGDTALRRLLGRNWEEGAIAGRDNTATLPFVRN